AGRSTVIQGLRQGHGTPCPYGRALAGAERFRVMPGMTEGAMTGTARTWIAFFWLLVVGFAEKK
ncbi:MAG: hypothetical protein ORN29_08930, partial [Rhodoferax sp.]|nr:hypothetical protein [Rhodoferax sp.]